MYKASSAVLHLLKAKGQEVILETPQGDKSYDPATGTYTYGEPDPIVVLGYPSEYKLSEIDNNTIVKGDQKILLASFDVDGNPTPKPVVSSNVNVSGEDFTVVNVQTILEGNTTLAGTILTEDDLNIITESGSKVFQEDHSLRSLVACYICQVRNG